GLGSGYLLWLREPTLFAQRFDAGNLRLEGDPVPVAQNVGTNGAGRAAFWAADAGLLVYRAVIGLDPKMAWISRNGTRGEEVQSASVGQRLSPDGKRAAFSRRTGAAGSNLWLVEFSSSVFNRLTFGESADSSPVWSPDGREVAFSSDRGGIVQIYRKS